MSASRKRIARARARARVRLNPHRDRGRDFIELGVAEIYNAP